LQLLDEGYNINHCSSNLNLTHGVTREVAKPQRVVAPQIKQGHLTTTNNPQYATKNEFLQLQVRKMSNIWATHGCTATNYLQLLNESCDQ
jgi:hypothetical protein